MRTMKVRDRERIRMKEAFYNIMISKMKGDSSTNTL